MIRICAQVTDQFELTADTAVHGSAVDVTVHNVAEHRSAGTAATGASWEASIRIEVGRGNPMSPDWRDSALAAPEHDGFSPAVDGPRDSSQRQ